MHSYLFVAFVLASITVLETSSSPAPSPPSSSPESIPSPVVDVMDLPTVSPVTMPPNPGFDPCIVCGEGKIVTNFTHYLSYPGYPTLSCKALQKAGLDGFIDPTYCGFLPSVIGEGCGCTEGSLAPTPATMPTPSTTTVPTSSSWVWSPWLLSMNLFVVLFATVNQLFSC